MDELHVRVPNSALRFFLAFAYALHGSLNIQAHVYEYPSLYGTAMFVHGV